MKRKLNKAIDLGISDLVEKGLDINIVVPPSTLIGVGITVIIVTAAIRLMKKKF